MAASPPPPVNQQADADAYIAGVNSAGAVTRESFALNRGDLLSLDFAPVEDYSATVLLHLVVTYPQVRYRVHSQDLRRWHFRLQAR